MNQEHTNKQTAAKTVSDYSRCLLCPRSCGVNRYVQTGFCGSPPHIKAARAALHLWEEPCISGINGSGAVFFGGCTLHCCYCQNYQISMEGLGQDLTPKRLSEICLSLQEQNAHNINLVTASQYLPSVIEALDLAGDRLHIPVVYNCGGYETLETVRALSPYVDIWLPDLKYYDSSLSKRCSAAQDYFTIASPAIAEMIRLAGPPVMETYEDKEQGRSCLLMKRGVLIRHMVLPGQKEDSIRLLFWLRSQLPENGFLLSLLSQYTPFYKAREHKELNRRITTYEYNKVLVTAVRLGLTNGYRQEKSSAREEYTPPFDLEGL